MEYIEKKIKGIIGKRIFCIEKIGNGKELYIQMHSYDKKQSGFIKENLKIIMKKLLDRYLKRRLNKWKRINKSDRLKLSVEKEVI